MTEVRTLLSLLWHSITHRRCFVSTCEGCWRRLGSYQSAPPGLREQRPVRFGKRGLPWE